MTPPLIRYNLMPFASHPFFQQSWRSALCLGLFTIPSPTLHRAVHAVEHQTNDDMIDVQRQQCLDNHDFQGYMQALHTPIQLDHKQRACFIEIKNALKTFVSATDPLCHQSGQKIFQTHVAKNLSEMHLLKLMDTKNLMNNCQQTARMMHIMLQSGLLDNKPSLTKAFGHFVNNQYTEFFEALMEWANLNTENDAIKRGTYISIWAMRLRQQTGHHLLSLYCDHMINAHDLHGACPLSRITDFLCTAAHYDQLEECLGLMSGHVFWSDNELGTSPSSHQVCLYRLKFEIKFTHKSNKEKIDRLIQWIDKEVEEARFIDQHKTNQED